MKKILATTTALALTATAAMAEPLTTWQADNYVKSASQRVTGTSTWAPGLKVKANGVTSFHFIGDGGVTPAMVFTDYEAAVAWAENMTGSDITAVGTTKASRGYGFAVECGKVVMARGRHGDDLVWR